MEAAFRAPWDIDRLSRELQDWQSRNKQSKVMDRMDKLLFKAQDILKDYEKRRGLVHLETRQALCLADYPRYKSNRVIPTDDLVIKSLPVIRDVLEGVNIPVMGSTSHLGCEADDVIGSLAVGASKHFDHPDISLVSVDKDFFQLIGPSTKVLRPKTLLKRKVSFTTHDLAWFKEAYHGLPPSSFADILALVGDPADSVPGVKGIGKVRAPKLLAAHGGTLETLLEMGRAGKVSPARFNDVLVEQAKVVLLSKELTTIDTSLDLKIDWDHFRV
mmetsp:Transcript_7098/g.13112  ORF Transcript_7098/g.13112 Transcript_7098/m.13112 type:complete len:273 (-) Transcript_7098:423-1241(-)